MSLISISLIFCCFICLRCILATFKYSSKFKDWLYQLIFGFLQRALCVANWIEKNRWYSNLFLYRLINIVFRHHCLFIKYSSVSDSYTIWDVSKGFNVANNKSYKTSMLLVFVNHIFLGKLSINFVQQTLYWNIFYTNKLFYRNKS